MRDQELGRLLRMLRLRRGWRQQDVARHAGQSATSIARAERGQAGSVELLRRHAATLDLRLEWRAVGRGAEVARLMDEEHAAIVELLATAFRAAGWQREVEVSYSRYGERGRYDLLAYERGSGTVAVVEAKTELADLQATLGGLDAKARLGPAVARERGWHASRTLVVLAVASTAGNRSVIRHHRSIFDSFEHRYLREAVLRPSLLERPGPLLLWVTAGPAGRNRWLAGRRRVRRPQLPA